MLRHLKIRKYRPFRRAVSASVSLALALWGPVTSGLVAGLLAQDAGAAATITNAGTAIYQNEANVAQTPVVATVNFTQKANPVLVIVKTASAPSGASGSRLEYSLALTYPQIGGACGDDSNAVSVTVTDTIPAGMTYVAASTSVSIDNGTTFTLGTGPNATVSFAANQVQVTFTNPIAECTTGAATRVVKFAVTVN